MSYRFVDVYAPAALASHPCGEIPEFHNVRTLGDNRSEQVDQRAEHAIYKFSFPQSIRDHATYIVVRNHWLAMRGDFHLWPFVNPLDHASAEAPEPNQEPVISAIDQVLEALPSSDVEFQLSKLYVSGTSEYRHPIYLPVVASVLVAVDGETEGIPEWSVSRPGGVILFESPPEGVVTAGFRFDVAVCYEKSDTFEGLFQRPGVSGYSDMILQEVPLCEEELE